MGIEDQANEILNGVPTTDCIYGEYATEYAVDAIAILDAVARLIKDNRPAWSLCRDVCCVAAGVRGFGAGLGRVMLRHGYGVAGAIAAFLGMAGFLFGDACIYGGMRDKIRGNIFMFLKHKDRGIYYAEKNIGGFNAGGGGIAAGVRGIKGRYCGRRGVADFNCRAKV